MPAWFVLLVLAVSAAATMLSLRGSCKAVRTGRLRFLLWHIPGWGERERDPIFFKLGGTQNYYRGVFFAILTVVAGAYFFEAVGVI